ncbi:putative metal-binding motif-containing protein [Melittangium boletus]|uniref:Uncharacterized protein n=1 Tax=Melittangium boletus DSM 14713 TaxID=1294270 RepID=A0A250I7D3_9BACT|nr:putative metal-binding motif-containing protein [Melittangium boletus]ATB27774.1 hypothetical protein MEBOL_001219 [Melittangium boletus DSM 14713]
MKHALVVLLACLVGCTVPTLEEIEATSPPYACSAEFACPAGQVCVGTQCLRPDQLACMPGTTESCGSGVGECREGTRTCGEQGSFGACEGETTAVAEVCDGLDNDCDGTVDLVSRLFERPSPGFALNATVFLGTSSLLTTSVEGGDILVRVLEPGQSPRLSESFGPMDKSTLILGHALLSYSADSAVVVWVEHVVGTERFLLRRVALDRKGQRITSPSTVTFSTKFSFLRDMRITDNAGQILLLAEWSNQAAPSEDGQDSRELWAVVLGKKDSSVLDIRVLGSATEQFGLHATANETGTGFLVAHERGGQRFLHQFSVGDSTVPTVSIPLHVPGSLTHSPFIADGVDKSLGVRVYFVQKRDSSPVSEIVSVRCVVSSSSDTSNCSPEATHYTDPHAIRRAWLGLNPKTGLPGFALFSWRDEGMSHDTLSVAPLSADSTSATATLLLPTESENQTLVVLPDSSRYVTFTRKNVSEPGAPDEAALLHFCAP